MTGPDEDPSGTAAADASRRELPSEPRPGQRSGPLPADPAAYDTERNQVARQKGLPTGYIPGGDDPDHARAVADDRRYLRILLAMVIVIVLAGFVLGIVAVLTGFTSLVGNPG